MPLAIALLAMVLAGLPAIPEYPTRGAPIEDQARSADLEERGYRNGHMPDQALVEAESNTRKTCRLEHEAAESWNQLMVHARHDGVDLRAASCYRSFSQQRSSYEYNCPVEQVARRRTVTTTDGTGEPQATVVTDYVPQRVCRVQTARPGNSNHGWGRAVDVTTRRNRLLTCRSKAFRWLQDNAHLYGFVHPHWARCGMPLEEAWHWEWAGTPEAPPMTMTTLIAE